MNGKRRLPKAMAPGKRQIHYLEIKGYPGRVYVNYFEFGRHFDMGGGRNSLRLPSPIMIRTMPGYRGSPLFGVISSFYARAKAADEGRPSGDPVIHECAIGVETKENGRVSYDIILKLKGCTVTDHNPNNDSPWIEIAFFDSEKTWTTW